MRWSPLVQILLAACGSSAGGADAPLPADATADGTMPDAAPDAAPAVRMHRRVAVVQYDPTDPAQPGHRLSAAMGWGGDVFAYSGEIADTLRAITDGQVDYEIVQQRTVDAFPAKRDGFRYDWASYQACRGDTSTCHFPDDAAYAPLLATDTGADLCAQIAAGQLDEIWVWGAGYFGFDEFAFKIPDDQPLVAPVPENYWIYDGRKKDLPACGRTYFVMGWLPERMEGHGLHSYGHRIESALIASPVGQGRWHRCGTAEWGTSSWTDYTCIEKDKAGHAGCGDVHYPPNATADYEYGNPAAVTSACDDWLDYPALDGSTTSVSAATWGGDEEGYLRWWMGHLPRVAGGDAAVNWWHHILCYDQPCPLVP